MGYGYLSSDSSIQYLGCCLYINLIENKLHRYFHKEGYVKFLRTIWD